MSDYTANGMPAGHRKVPRAEYRIYFGAIFVAALPFAAVAWGAGAVRGRAGRDPVSRALSDARAITPMIFSA